MLSRGGTLVAGLLAALLMFVPPVLRGPAPDDGHTLHPPILIEGDAGFTASNGVVSGSGTTSDPYLIRGWEINATESDGVVIRNTRASFLLQDIRIYSDNRQFQAPMGVHLVNVSDGRVERLDVANVSVGLQLEDVADVRVRDSRFVDNWEGMVLRTTSQVTIQGSLFSNTTFGGLSAEDSSGLTISQNSVSGGGGGFLIAGNATDVLLSENDVSGGFSGIVVVEAFDGQTMRNISVVGNRISGVDLWGIYLGSVRNVTLQGNTLAEASVVIEGTNLADYNSHTLAPDNLVNGRPLRFYKDCRGLAISDLTAGQVIVANCVDVRLGRLAIDLAEPGILLAFVEGASILLSTLSDAGIDVVYSRNVTISRSIISGAGAAVSAVGVEGLVLGGNVFERNGNGVYLRGARNVTVSGNVLVGNIQGIDVERADNATFVGNVLSGNTIGLYAPFPIGFQAFENSFVDNSIQVFENPAIAHWYDGGYPTGGNFWSDYSGADLCNGPIQDVCSGGDGFGDVPYQVDADSRDRYPRMGPRTELNRYPQASVAIDPPRGGVSTLFTFDATSSSDPEDPASALEVRWDWEDDGVWDTTWSFEKVTRHRFAASGTYTVRVEVRDSGLLRGNTTLTVTVTPEGPGAEVWIPVIVGTGVVASGFGIAFVYFRRRRPGNGGKDGRDGGPANP